jgi:hypothetical protein
MAGRDTVDSTRQDLYQWLDNVGQVYVKEGVSNVCWPGREGGWVICWANYREYLIIYDNFIYIYMYIYIHIVMISVIYNHTRMMIMIIVYIYVCVCARMPLLAFLLQETNNQTFVHGGFMFFAVACREPLLPCFTKHGD